MPKAEINGTEIQYRERGEGYPAFLLHGFTGNLRNWTIQIPTLVICGENDDPFLELSHRMHERIPDSELTIIAGAGHTPQIEKPEEFNRVLTGFLSRVHQGVAAGG